MKRIAFFSLFLALGFIIVQPLYADTIAYTIQGNFFAPSYSEGDPLGIGSGSATAIFSFTLTPPNSGVISDPSFYSQASYDPAGMTLTLIGTNADGNYTPAILLGYAHTNAVLLNSFSALQQPDSFSAGLDCQVNGLLLSLGVAVHLPASFWQDSEDPPLPKLLSQSDVIDSSGQIEDITNSPSKVLYNFSSLTVSSQVVPLPPTVWLLGSGLLGLVGWRRFGKG